MCGGSYTQTLSMPLLCGMKRQVRVLSMRSASAQLEVCLAECNACLEYDNKLFWLSMACKLVYYTILGLDLVTGCRYSHMSG